MKPVVFVSILIILIGCNDDKVSNEKPTYDSAGQETKECRVRAADGSGPYNYLGRFTVRKCERAISDVCKKTKYKQRHKDGGYFARGKFGYKILIGVCR
jgi:hypothetical protein